MDEQSDTHDASQFEIRSPFLLAYLRREKKPQTKLGQQMFSLKLLS